MRMKGEGIVNNNINLKQNIRLQVRIQVLYDVIKNLSLSFGFPDTVINTLYKGIVEKQAFDLIYAYYINNSGKTVGKVSFKIDWEKHELFASTDTGKNIRLRTDLPLISQFASWTEDIINYMDAMRRTLNVKKIQVNYRYRKEILCDSNKVKELDKALNLVTSTFKADYDKDSALEFERRMSFTSEMLPELTINIETGK